MIVSAKDCGSESDIVGGSRLGPGIYHVAINHCAEEAAKSSGNPGLAVEFMAVREGLVGYKTKKNAKGRVVAFEGGTPTENQSGRTLAKFFAFVGKDQDATDFCQKCVLRFALAANVVRPGEEKEPDWSEAVGRELIIEIDAAIYKDKAGNERSSSDLAAFGMWSLGNPAVANVPKDPTTPGMQQLAKAGGPPNHPGDGDGGQTGGAAATVGAGATTVRRTRFSDL